MPRLPRISSLEVIRVLERLGFYQARQRESP
jgi:predicted RNA binding protein YcfA (HicA-like mRNA interferase family)